LREPVSSIAVRQRRWGTVIKATSEVTALETARMALAREGPE
jgi:hypothetical protein